MLAHALWVLLLLPLTLILPQQTQQMARVSLASLHSQSIGNQLTPIYLIQGATAESGFQGQWVDTAGIVTAVGPTGFFIQDPIGDHNPDTSNGIFVYTRERPSVAIGQCMIVERAFVDEFYAKTELSRIKRVLPASICGQDHVTPTTLPASVFQTEIVGAELAAILEQYEGMLVRISSVSGTVQGPTRQFADGEQEVAFLPASEPNSDPTTRVFREGAHEKAPLHYFSTLLGAKLPPANWGDRIIIPASPDTRSAAGDPVLASGVLAIVDYNFGKFQYLVLPGQTITIEPTTHSIEAALPVPASDGADFSVCTYNLHGMGQGSAQYPTAERYTAELERRARQIATWLNGCTVLALQEVGVPADAHALATKLNSIYGYDYQSIALAGPASAHQDYPLTNAVLVRKSRVAVDKAMLAQGCSAVDYQIATLPTPAGGAECAAGHYPLFNRPPLVVDVTVSGFWDPPLAVQIINNHWKSKAGDEEQNARRREMQAHHVLKLVQEWLDSDTDNYAIVLGDLNDYYHSQPISRLATGTEPDLINTVDYVSRAQQYSYIFDGYSQTLDYVLLSANFATMLAGVHYQHINADYATVAFADGPTPVSDHDPIWVRLRPTGVANLGGTLGIADQIITVQDSHGKLIAQQRTDLNGNFQFWDLQPGSIIVHVPRDQPHHHTGLYTKMQLHPGYNRLIIGLTRPPPVWSRQTATDFLRSRPVALSPAIERHE